MFFFYLKTNLYTLTLSRLVWMSNTALKFNLDKDFYHRHYGGIMLIISWEWFYSVVFKIATNFSSQNRIASLFQLNFQCSAWHCFKSTWNFCFVLVCVCLCMSVCWTYILAEPAFLNSFVADMSSCLCTL